eukprot:SAG22_NODE_2330_length_2707_cov_11.741181_2_plen_227_part_00
MNFPLCTIAETPRLPDHCIEWASVLQWPEHFPEQKLDGDDPKHIMWVYEKALGRAQEHSIDGVTYQLAQGVVKRIIPAVASTNAVIAAACAAEAFKYATYSCACFDNYMMFNGTDGLYVYTFEYERKEDCLVCGSAPVPFSICATDTVGQVMAKMTTDPTLQLKQPSIRCNGKSVYMRQPVSLEEATRPNLDKPATEFFAAGAQVTVTDPTLPHPPWLKLVIDSVA